MICCRVWSPESNGESPIFIGPMVNEIIEVKVGLKFACTTFLDVIAFTYILSTMLYNLHASPHVGLSVSCTSCQKCDLGVDATLTVTTRTRTATFCFVGLRHDSEGLLQSFCYVVLLQHFMICFETLAWTWRLLLATSLLIL